VSQVASWGSIYAMDDYAGVMVEWLSASDWESNKPASANTAQAFSGLLVKGGQYRSDNPALTQKFGKVSVGAVPDGTSNTLAIAEKAVSARQYSPKVWDWWELPGWSHGADWPNMRLAGNWVAIMPDNQYPRIDWTNNANGSDWFWEPGFGSAHSGIFNGVFGDGSVRPIKLSIGNCGNAGWSDNTCVLYRLGKRDDGQIVDHNSL
jgi:hypothetical protein